MPFTKEKNPGREVWSLGEEDPGVWNLWNSYEMGNMFIGKLHW